MGHFVGVAKLGHGGRGVTAAHNGDGVGLGQGLGHSPGALGKGGDLKHAHGAVPDNGAGLLHGRGIQGDGLGTDVHTHHAVGDTRAVHGHRLGIGGKLRGGHAVHGQEQLDALVLGLLHHLPAVVQPVGLQQGVAHADALGLGKGIAHAAADDDGVGNVQQVIDHADLGGHLGAAQDRHQGALGVSQGAAHNLQLLLDQEAGHGGQVGCHAGGGGVGAVHGAEGVGHVHVGHGRHFPGQLGVVLGLALLKAGVLQQQDLAGLQGGGFGGGIGADHVGGHDDLAAQQLAQALGHGSQAELGIGSLLGFAQVGAGDHRRILLQQVLDGGQGGHDALVVGDGTGGLVLGHIEVAAQQDLLARYVDILYGLLVVVHKASPFIAPSPVRPGKSSCRRAS